MTAYKFLTITVMWLVAAAWCMGVHADDDVTIVTAPDTKGNASSPKPAEADTTPVVHTSLHKKKATDPATATTSVTAKPKPATTASTAASPATAVSHEKTLATKSTPSSESAVPATVVLPAAPPSSVIVDPPAVIPTVETGLPIARHSGSTPPLLPSGMPLPVSSTVVSTQVPVKSTDNYPFTDYKKPTNKYPWKTNIITTIFWIGESGSSLSSTNQHSSAWIEDWRQANGGSDTPDNRIGYSPADYAARVNLFYVALPFNDLADPEKARRWLPAGWHRANQDGKQVSACKDRWVEIKNAQGRVCYAQWEDVGPLEWDHAEYVFGDERPNTATRAGLDVSPDVARYLGMDTDKATVTSWRFVDDGDVPPGLWLVYEEREVFYNALHKLKNTPTTLSPPLENSSEPDNVPGSEGNRKKVGAAKG